MKTKLLALVWSFALAAMTLTACAEIDDGRYNEGNPVTENPTITQPTDPDNPISSAPTVSSEETTTTVSEPEPLPKTSLTDVSDAIEELYVTGQWDYATLSTEGDGFGHGSHYDDANRPSGARRFNNGYSQYNATAMDQTDEKIITLTFDEGYENGYTPQILDTLKEKGVRAIFFIVQDYAERQPELVQRMIDEGHIVANHSVNHYSMPELTVEEMRSEIMGLHEYMIENFGVQMTYFRPPKGEYSELSLAVTGDCGYKTMLWSFAYADWDPDTQPEPASSLQKMIDRLHPGAIYLLHAVSETNASVLGDFIDTAREAGYTFK